MQGRYSISTETNGSRPLSYPPAARYNGSSNNGYVEDDDSIGRGRQLGNRPVTSSSYATKSSNGSNYELDDDATYHLDHLTTFTVSPNRGLSTPNDAIARLRHMAQTSGIWTKRLRLRVGARDLVVVEGTEPIERFPLRLVTDAVCETTPVESYNNVVVVTVAGDDKMGLRRRIPASEMHLFHCLYKPGQGLVDDILTAKAGKPLRKHAPVSASQSAPVQPIYAHPTKKTSAVDNSSPTTVKQLEHKLSTEEKRTIDLKVLDFCFGEIERFVAHLQNAAREQKLKETGLSSDVIRAPPAKEFFDIFQKVKLSFILLARLKHEIRDPNASELVHALFTPFKLIIDASRDAVTNQAQLASQVVAPLLTTDAVELLNNCLSSHESELLGLLGTAWTTPRNRWKDNIPQFHPHFAEGYTPPVAWTNDVLFDPVTDSSPDWLQSSQNSAFTGISTETPDSLDYEYPGIQSEQSRSTEDIKKKLARDYTRRQELEWKRAQQRDRILSQDASRGSSSADVTSIDDRQQQEFLHELRTRNANICLVTKRREACNTQELTVEANEIVELTDDSRNWWKVMNCRLDVGFVPSSILQKFN